MKKLIALAMAVMLVILIICYPSVIREIYSSKMKYAIRKLRR